MSEKKFFLYDSTDDYCNDMIEELKNNNLLSSFVLIDKNRVNPNNIHPIIKQCLIKCQLPTLLLPNTNGPIEKNDVKGWIKSMNYFDIKTNNIKVKENKINNPQPDDKLGIPKQEIKKISDNYTFIDEKNTVKLFENPNKETLILKDNHVTTEIIEKTEQQNKEQKARILKMIRAKK